MTAVQLREVLAQTWAVLVHSGTSTDAAVQQRTNALVAWLAEQK